MLGRVLAREPLSRIVGVREFWGLEFLLSADTLDPRPETETVVEAVLRRLPDRSLPYRFLDLGTGSGCILLALLIGISAGDGLGIDIAAGRGERARSNAAQLGLGAIAPGSRSAIGQQARSRPLRRRGRQPALYSGDAT